jgi:hypothetical protein
MASGRVSKVKGKILDIPANAPTIGTATDAADADGGKVSVAFTAPSTDTGGPIFSYLVTSNPGSITGTGSSSPIVVSGLTDNTSYTFTVVGRNPSGNSVASAASNSATPTMPFSSGMESIATTTLSSSQSVITFSSIPATFKHLQVRMLARTDVNGASDNIQIYFNGDNTNAYSRHQFTSDFGSPSSATADPDQPLFTGTVGGNTNNANVFGLAIIDVVDYSVSGKLKVTKAFTGVDYGTNGYMTQHAGTWNNTSVITSVSLSRQSGSNFVAGSRFALYGLKG